MTSLEFSFMSTAFLFLTAAARGCGHAMRVYLATSILHKIILIGVYVVKTLVWILWIM